MQECSKVLEMLLFNVRGVDHLVVAFHLVSQQEMELPQVRLLASV